MTGFIADLSTFLCSRNNTMFSSYVRIHNNDVVAGSAAIQIETNSGRVFLGTYMTCSIDPNCTFQLGAADIENHIGMAGDRETNYHLLVDAPFRGYAQHIIFNAATGQIADISSVNLETPPKTTAGE